MAKPVAKVVRNSEQFGAVCEAVLERGAKVRFRANGLSMRPNILNDDAVVIAPLEQEALRRGDIALTYGESGFKVHRVAAASRAGIITRSDAGHENDPPPALVLGKLVQIERAGRRENVKSFTSPLIHAGRLLARRLNQAAAIRIARLRWSFALFSIAVLLGVLVNAAPAAGQAFAITDTAAPTTVAPGGTITYTQVLSNTSGATITHPITVTQNLPANTTFVSAAKTGGHHNWTCALNTGVITCTDTNGGNYASGNNTTFTVVVTVNAGTANGTVITDTVNAQGANTGVATASANVTVQTPDLSVSETAAPNPVATGANITYTETVTNNSATVDAAGATLTQNTAPGTLFQSVTPPAGWTCGTQPAVGGTGAIICTANGAFAAATSLTFTVVVSVSPEAVAGSTITNSVTVSETGTDPNPGNDTATASVQVQGADLSMTQVASATAIAPGSTITYTETVANAGPNAATNAILYQQTPPNTTFASMTPPAGWTCGTQPGVGATGTVLCTANAAMNANTTTGNFVFVVTVNAGAAAGTSIVNSADVTSQTSDPNASNNATTTSVLVEITGDADLSLSMTAQPTPVFISSNLTYTIQIQDLGLSNTADGTLIDTIPAGTAFVSSASTQGSCSGTATVTCALGAINRGTPITVTITVTAPASPTTLTNTASVSSSTTDPVAANNSATVLTVVQPLVCASPGRDGAGGTLTGIVNTYYPPANAGTLAAGSTSVALGAAAAGGAQTPIAAGDLLLFIQAQDAAINSTNTGAYGDGFPGDPASGWTALNNSGNFEFVTATNAVPVGGGTLNFQGTGPTGGLLNTYTRAAATAGQGQRTYQIIRVPQYSSAVLSSGLTAMIWNGATGGVLALDVASQLTLGGTVAVDGLGFRGGGGRILGGGTGTAADYVTLSTNATNGSKGEGIAGTPRFVVDGPITSTAQTPTDTGVEGLPNGSYARGAPGTAGGGATDANPPANDQNSGGGGGGNGGTGGTGGFGWNSAGIVGGFGGTAFPVSTSALAMGGGGGAGTTNNGSFWNPSTDTGGSNCGANCTGIYSSGSAGAGIVIIHAGSVIGTGTITANGLSGLAEENDGGGGGGAGGTILVFSNSGGLGGLTASAIGGNGGTTWPEQVPGAFPGNRHGPGAGGGGGVVLSSAALAGTNVAGGNPGVSTLANDAYGATVGQPGVAIPGLSITQTPGTQSGAFCAGADLAVTNSGSPNPVLAGPGPGNIITYTQSVTNNGPQDSLNAVFSETIPANTTFQSLNVPSGSGWTCVAPAIGGTGTISCTNPDVPKAASTTFTVTVAVNTGVAAGTVITDIDNVTAGTSDPVLTNNSATVQTTVGLATTADLSITKTNAPNPVIAGNNLTYTIVVTNNGAGPASTVALTDAIPMSTTFVSATPVPAAGWTCGVAGGTLTCSNPLVAAGASTTITVVVTVNAGTAAGTVITNTANVSSATTDPNPNNNSATATAVVATAGQADLAVTSSASPNPVTDGNNITYAQSVTNNGPAASGTATFTDTIPAGTTFVSFAVPAGWNCGATVPAVGGTGTISCSIASLLVNATASFPLVVKVSLGDTPGTTITNTANINVPCSSVTDPNCANNSATTNVTVASPTQADVAIVKTASPEPVDQGTNLTYTLQVTNNGPALAVNVNVSDPLPSEVTFASVSTTQGICTYTAATTTVNCALGNLSVGGLALITINVTANTFSSSTLATNTATVSATTSDPNLANNTSSVTSTIAAPTAVQLASFRAFSRQGGGVLLEWKTREEIRNLGFNVFRLEGDNRQRLNPSIIAGSALLIRGGSPQHAAKTYQWFDPQGTVQSTYLLEDVDLNGTRMPHGPISVDTSVSRSGGLAQPMLLTQLNRATVQPAGTQGRVGQRLSVPHPRLPVLPPNIVPAALDGEAAVKISVESEGWYQVPQAQLVAAGLDANADVRTLKLYAEGVEQPLLILGRQAGPLGPNDSIEFYGTGIDTPFSGTRVYWLVSGGHFGKRIPSVAAQATGLSEPQSFPFTVVLQQRTTYFATLLNGENNDNFFGAAVTSAPVDQPLTVAHADPNSPMQITVDITLQGATDQQAHSVSVAFNGASIGEMDFANLANVTNTLPVDRSLLQDGVNTVTLTALQGDNDVSVVQSIALHYPHTYTADADWLKATASAGEGVHISGFSNPQIQVFDITNPLAILQLDGAVAQEQSGYGVTLSVAGPAGEERTLLAFSAGQILPAAGLAFHAPSRLLRQREGSEMVILTHPDFEPSLGPLVSLHESRGTSVEVVTIDDVFDAFNYGERSPFAMRAFLQEAVTHWRVKPKYLLLVGDASLDPRNYLGLGDFDFVPTRMIETAAFKTASDDWFSDFQQNGFATIATGRIPARTAADAALVVSKIVNFEQSVASGSASQQALLVADQNIDADFSTATKVAAADLPSSLQPVELFADGLDPTVVQQQLLPALNSGPLLVNYSGHGSVEQLSFADFLDDSSAATLTNSNQYSVYFLMDCLNGFFQDVYSTSLAESLLLAPEGGAAAVWASSGFTIEPPQASMNQALLQILKSNPSLPLGTAILGAKSGVTDNDVRRTWILFGDPAMVLLPPAPASAAGSHVPPRDGRRPNRDRTYR